MPVVGRTVSISTVPTFIATGTADVISCSLFPTDGNILVGGPTVTDANGLIIVMGSVVTFSLKPGDALYAAAPAPTNTHVLLTRQ